MKLQFGDSKPILATFIFLLVLLEHQIWKVHEQFQFWIMNTKLVDIFNNAPYRKTNHLVKLLFFSFIL